MESNLSLQEYISGIEVYAMLSSHTRLKRRRKQIPHRSWVQTYGKYYFTSARRISLQILPLSHLQNLFRFRLAAGWRCLNNLIVSLVVWKIQIVLLRDWRWKESILLFSNPTKNVSILNQDLPPTNEMPPFEKVHQRLRRRQANKRFGVIICPRARTRWPIFDIPRWGCVDC